MRREIAIAVAMGLVMLLLTACASEGWHAEREFRPLAPVVFEAPLAAVQAACRAVIGRPIHRSTYGCAQRVPTLGICRIFIAEHPARWQLDHELHHCEGFNHDDL